MSDSTLTKFEFSYEGIGELLKSADIMAVCQEIADGVQAKCGAGYETSAYTGVSRVNVSVYAADSDAQKDNLQNNTLLKAIGQ